MLLLAAKMLQKLLNVKIGWVAHRKFLLKQANRENIEKGIKADISFISMFEKNVSVRPELLIIDECLPGYTKLTVLDKNKKLTQTTLREVIENNVGVKVLSYNTKTKETEFNNIVSRTPTGIKELYEITINVNGKLQTLEITEEGKLYVENKGYIKVTELKPGDKVITNVNR